MPRRATIEAEGLVVLCPQCGRHQPNSRGMLVWFPSELAAEIAADKRAKLPRVCARSECQAGFTLPSKMLKRVAVEGP